jgi:hypothetical protein
MPPSQAAGQFFGLFLFFFKKNIAKTPAFCIISPYQLCEGSFLAGTLLAFLEGYFTGVD